MLLVVVLLPLSSPMYGGEFDHGGGGDGCGGPGQAMDGVRARARAIDGVTVTLRRWNA